MGITSRAQNEIDKNWRSDSTQITAPTTSATSRAQQSLNAPQLDSKTQAALNAANLAQQRGYNRTVKEIQHQNALITERADELDKWNVPSVSRLEQAKLNTPSVSQLIEQSNARIQYNQAKKALTQKQQKMRAGSAPSSSYDFTPEKQAIKDAEELMKRLGLDDEIDPTFWERVAKTVTGAGLSFGAQHTGTAATLQGVNTEYELARQRAGVGPTHLDEERGDYRPAQQRVMESYSREKQLERTYDEASLHAAQDIERAKLGLGTVGNFVVDTSVAGLQMLADSALGAGTGAMTAMLLRSFGGAAQEARQAGGNTLQQVAYGVGNAVLEYITEKLFGGNPVYDSTGALASTADLGWVNKAINSALRQFGNDDVARRVMSVLGSTAMETLNEGWEEVVSDLVNPILKEIVLGVPREKIEARIPELVESFVVGVALGGMGRARVGIEVNATGARVQKSGLQSALVENALKMDQSTEAFKLAQDIATGKKEATTHNIGTLYGAFVEAGGPRSITGVAQQADTGETTAQTEGNSTPSPTNAAEGRKTASSGKYTIGDAAKAYLDSHPAMKAKTAQQKAKVVQRLIDGKKTTTAEVVSGLRLRDKAWRATFSEITGVQFPESVRQFTDEQLHEIAMTAADIAAADAAEAEIESADAVIAAESERINALTAEAERATMEAQSRLETTTVNMDGEDVDFAGFLRRVQEQVPDATAEEVADTFLRIAQTQDRITAEDYNTYKEALNYGRQSAENGNADGLSGNPGERSNRARGGLDARAGGAEAEGRGERGQAATDAGTGEAAAGDDGGLQRAQEADAAEVNLPTTTETREDGSVVNVVDQKAFEASETGKTLTKMFSEIGAHVRGMIGLIDVYGRDANGERVRISRANGETLLNRDTTRCSTLVNVADARYTGEQLGGHEFGHIVFYTQPKTLDAAWNAMLDAMTEEQWYNALQAYAAVYESDFRDGMGISPEAELSAQQRLALERFLAEEMLCDANGGLTRNGIDMSVYHDVVAAQLAEGVEGIKKEIAVRKLGEELTESIENGTLADVGVNFDSKSESANPTRFSLATWNKSDYTQDKKAAANDLAEALTVSVRTATKYINDVNSIAKMIADDRTRLDYEASPGRSAVLPNTDYGASVDFSTICKKRRLLTGTLEAIQRALPDNVLMADDVLSIRDMMKRRGYEVSCGLCYVEGSRAKMGEYAADFIRLFKKYYSDAEWTPNLYDVNTPTGAEQMRVQHPDVYQEYEHFWNNNGTLRSGDPKLFSGQGKPKLFQSATEYNGEILRMFKRGRGVEKKNRNGGLRLQSFSDFEIIHLLDTMQVITDMSRVGLAGQAYTKVPDFAWAVGDTGLKVNLSLIAKGVDKDGRIVLDDIEGMPRADAEALRKAYTKNVGTILVVFDDAQLTAAMNDPFIDFIIPFHRSQWSKGQFDALGLPAGAKDYTDQQNESYLERKVNPQGRTIRPSNYMPNEYWDFSKTGKENAQEYLKMCAEDGRRPKFYKLLVNNGDGSYSLQPDGSTDGYWKLLIDFKMYDNAGKGSPQTPVRPRFNMDEAERMLSDYAGGHEQYPVARDVVDEFLAGEDVRYSIAGEQAVGANLGILADAKQLDQDGKSAEEVWKETGWWKGTDGEWRFEIDDSGAMLRDNVPDESGKLIDFIEHDALFNAYPFLRDVNVARDLPTKGANGAAVGREIRVKRNLDGAELLSTLLHEAQHLVQVREGFANGSSMEIAYRNLFIRTLDDIIRDPKHWKDFQKLTTYQGRIRRIENEMIKRSEDPEFQSDPASKMFDVLWTNYANAIGEQEARNVQERAMLSAEERSAEAPYLAQEGVDTSRRVGEKTAFHDLHGLLGQPKDANGNVLVDKLYAPLYDKVKKGAGLDGQLDLGENPRDFGIVEDFTEDGTDTGARRGAYWRSAEEVPSQLNEQALRNALNEASARAGASSMPERGSSDRDAARYSVSAPPNSEAFKNWFRESKVVNEDGTPKTMYHGTSRAGFRMFDTYGGKFGLFGKGSYFTDDPSVASSYTEKGKGTSKGVYPVYLSVQNPIDMDAPADLKRWRESFEDNDWNTDYLNGAETNEDAWRDMLDALADEGYYQYDAEETAQDVLRFMGYDGITHIGGGRYGAKDGPRHRVFIVFDPGQVKSIYNQGDFNPENPDIRYSISPDLQQYLDDLVAKYGKMPESAGSVRPTNVPNRTAPENKVSRTAATVMGAAVTPDTRMQTIAEAVKDDKLSYTPTTNKIQTSRARAMLQKKGWADSVKDWEKAAASGRASAYNVAMGAELLNNAMNNDAATPQEVVDLITTYSQMLRSAGQTVQAAKILQNLTPAGQLYGIQRAVDKMNEQMLKKMKGYDPDTGEFEGIQLDPAYVKEFLDAKTDEERGEALDRMAQDVADKTLASGMDLLTAWRYLNMLGNFRTQIRNLAGNAAFQPVRIAKDAMVGVIEAGLQKAGVDIGRTSSVVRDKETLKAAADVYDEYEDAILAGGKYNDNVGDDFAGRVEKKRRIFNGTQYQLWNKTAGNALEKYRRGTEWAMDKGDALFCKFTFCDSLARFMAANKTTWEQADEGLRARAVNKAVRDAAEAAYRDNSTLARWVSRGLRGDGTPWYGKLLGEGVMPFRKTPANVLLRSLEYSPLGAIGALKNTASKVRGNAEITGNDLVEQWAKALTGTGLATLGFALASMGRLIGGPPKDDDEETLRKQQGYQPYSLVLNVDGKMQTFTLDWAAPAAVPLFFGANFAQGALENGLSMKDALAALNAISDPIFEMSMLQGIRDTLESVSTYGTENALASLLANSATNLASQFVGNTLIGQLRRSATNDRQTTYVDKNATLPDSWQYQLGKLTGKTVLPGYHQIPYIDAWGDVAQNVSGNSFGIPDATWNAITQLFSPGYVSQVKQDETLTELARLYQATNDGGIVLDRPKKYFTVDGERLDLDDGEYVTYAVTRGQTAKQTMSELISSDGYARLPDDQKVVAIERIYDFANQIGKATVSSYEPDKWVTRVAESDIPVATYATAYAATKDITGMKDKDGKTVPLSRDLRIMQTLYDIPGLDAWKAKTLAEDLEIGKTVLGYTKQKVESELKAMDRKYAKYN